MEIQRNTWKELQQRKQHLNSN